MLAGLGWLLLNGRFETPGHWDGTVTFTLLIFCLIQGAVIGALNGGLSLALGYVEQVAVSILLSLALGALRVMAGGFDGDSLLPLAIFGLAIVNGGGTAVTLLLILHRTGEIDESHLLTN
jgi:hypothetical protein